MEVKKNMYSEVVRYFRKHNHLTQDELADKLNVKRHTICDWESGRTGKTDWQ